jgi:hypothetical protein
MEAVAGFGIAGVESQTLWLVESRNVASEAIRLMTERFVHVAVRESGVKSVVIPGRAQ